ncbi:Uncharacterised protein [Morganella morganii]|nr:Uncharacterised protein [Morganella morganii]
MREIHVTGRPRHQRKPGSHKDGRHNRETIEAVSQVHRVTGADNHEICQQDIQHTQLRHHIFKERHHQLGCRGIFTDGIHTERHSQRQHGLPEIFPAGNQPFGVFAHHFAVVIDKADNTVADQHQQHTPDIRVVQTRPQQNRNGDGEQDHHAAHGRGTALAEVRFRPFTADNLANLHSLEIRNHMRPHP